MATLADIDSVTRKRLQTARQLVKEGNVTAAATLLENTRHPLAGKMLKQLKPRVTRAPHRTRNILLFTLMVLVIAGIVLYFGIRAALTPGHNAMCDWAYDQGSRQWQECRW